MTEQILPDGLPIPADDGACDHIEGMLFPPLTFASTHGPVTLSSLSETIVLYIYPRSSADAADLVGWDDIPGARGCSPQGCAFRDHQSELLACGAQVFGLATQDVSYLQSEVERLHLPFPLISDNKLELKEQLGIPLLETQIGEFNFYKRITLIIRKG